MLVYTAASEGTYPSEAPNASSEAHYSGAIPIGPWVGEAAGIGPGLAQQGDGIFRKFVFLETSPSGAFDVSVAGQMGQPNIAGGFGIHEDEHVARHFQTRVHRIDVEK